MRMLAALILTTAIAYAQATMPRQTFKVASWNIRSGMGISGLAPAPPFASSTINCTDRTRPLNAWGVGVAQKVLEAIDDDPAVVALALNEAWNCAHPAKVNEQVLEWNARSPERNGVAMLARHGVRGEWRVHMVGSGAYQSYLVGGDVCLDEACATAIPMYATHWGGEGAEFPGTARNVIRIVDSHAGPRLFMGDLNIYKIDRWNPRVPCTNPDSDWRLETIRIIAEAGFSDAWKETRTGEGWTGMASRNGCGTPNGNLFKRVDYIHFKELTAVSTVQLGRVAPGHPAPSDHVMLVATLSLPASRPTRK